MDSDFVNTVESAYEALQKGDYDTASSLFYKLSIKTLSIDKVLYYQFFISYKIAGIGTQITEQRTPIREVISDINRAISETQAIDDRVEYLFSPLLEHFTVLDRVLSGDAANISKIYAINRGKWIGNRDLFSVLNLLACAMAKIEHLMIRPQENRHVIYLSISEFHDDVTECVNNNLEDRMLGDILNVVLKCLDEIKTILSEAESLGKDNCSDKAKKLRERYTALVSIHRLIESTILNLVNTDAKGKVPMKIDIHNPQGSVNVAETVSGDFNVESQILKLDDINDALQRDPNLDIPQSVINTVNGLIETKRITETEIYTKFPFFGARLKRIKEET